MKGFGDTVRAIREEEGTRRRRVGVESVVGSCDEVAAAEEFSAEVLVERVKKTGPVTAAVEVLPLRGDGGLRRRSRRVREETLKMREAARGHVDVLS